jgi:hypothetical protein
VWYAFVRMAFVARELATYEDLLALPEGVRAEVIGGEVLAAPSPSPDHQSSLSLLCVDLVGAYQRGRGGPGGWWIVPDVDVSFGAHDILRPDLAGWRRARVPEFPRERPIAHRPAWVCEICLQVLLRATADPSGTRIAPQACRGTGSSTWPIAPITVLRHTSEGYVDHQTAGDEGTAALAPFDELALELAGVFPPRR